jgi:FkbM family methyltransferase
VRLPGFVFKLFARALPVYTYTVRGVPIKAIVPLHQIGTYQAAETWSTREPETLDWLDTLSPTSILFDVGANMGNESLYAALKSNGPARIYAFDIEFQASYNLALNITLNGLEGRVENYFVALGDREGFINVEERTNYLRVAGRPKYDRSHKWVPVTALDVFSRQLGVNPTHVKVDVDGPEASIVRGMREMLGGDQLRSLLIEINSAESGTEIRTVLNASGFREVPHGHANRHNVIFTRP